MCKSFHRHSVAQSWNTSHYSVAQVLELLDTLNLIADESNRTNANLEMQFREKAGESQSVGFNQHCLDECNQ